VLCPVAAARAQASVAAAPRLAFRHLTIADGLSQNAVTAIVQDRRGFLWLGTRDGLNRHDGRRFEVHRHDPFDATSLPGGDVTALLEDRRGALWVGTRDAGAARFDRRTERFAPVPGGPTGHVTAFAEDASGAVWLGTATEGLYRCTFAADGTMRVERVAHAATDPASLGDDHVRALLVDRRGTLWVGTDAGLDRLEGVGAGRASFAHVTSRTPPPLALADARVTALHEDERGRLWLGGITGVAMLDSARTAIRHFFHRYRTFRYGWGEAASLATDPAGTLWIATRSELMQLDPATGIFTYRRRDERDPEGPSSDLPTVVYRDRSDVMWVGTNGFGVDVHDPKATRFRTYRRPPGMPSRLAGFSVYTIFEDRAGALWLDAGLLYRLDRGTGTLRSFETDSRRPDDFGNTGVWAIVEDPAGWLWAGGYRGLFRHEVATGRTRHYRHDPADTAGLPEEVVYDVFRDREGAIWAVTENFLLRLADTTRGRFERWRHKPRATGGQWIFPSLRQDARGALWLGSDQGLARFEPRTGTFTRWRHDPRDPRSLAHDAVRALLPDPRAPDRALWVATAGGGLDRLDLASGRFTHLTVRDGLPNDVVYAVLADARGMLWASTNRGLARVDPATRAVRTYDARDGLQGDEFNSGSAFAGRDGTLYFGGLYGVSWFRPEAVRDNPHAPVVAITGFRRGDRLESVRDSGTVLPAAIGETDTLRVSWRDAVLTFEFAALEYSAPGKNRYAYRMRGLNDAWVQAGAAPSATYTNLPPGRYVFEVKATNNDGVWSTRPAALSVLVAPPWWRTGWAYALYAALALAVLEGARRATVARLRLQRRLERERLAAEQLRELERARSRLFANVSHEFRTPLTLTMGPLDDLRAGMHGPLAEPVAEQVALARRNAGRVLALIDELLELARAEAGRTTLRARALDLGDFTDAVARGFRPLAERKAIAYDVQRPPRAVTVWADPEHLERALSNLLSNAFKFTPDGGAVRVAVAADDASARITVRDSGPGIAADEVARIFDRFHRAGATAASYPGTGIGLALARELVVLHGGTIGVESEAGFGSSFTVTLPTGRAHLSPEQLADEGAALAWVPRTPSDVALASPPPTPVDASDDDAVDVGEGDAIERDVTTVLVVDDNAEVRAFVRQHLASRYRVLEAADGTQGLALARSALPDLVLADVMMPGLDGMALCRALRADPETDFLPVILLSARAETEDRLAGLADGADDYLTKPFDVRELLARIGNTIAARRRLRERAAASPVAGPPVTTPDGTPVVEGPGAPGRPVLHPSPVQVTAADARFLEQVRAAVERHMGDDGLTIERLASEVAHSRGHLHRRLRELTGESPSELVRRMRLERAAALLAAGAGSVGEVAYTVGFKSVAHFSNAFHELTGVRPSAWRAHARALAEAAEGREPAGTR
jgi:signal transduction histidine kinase/ligand-binding sensor domain-containing protein/CheY-like chemotaxis protein/AraC-like DNA-binding protein